MDPVRHVCTKVIETQKARDNDLQRQEQVNADRGAGQSGPGGVRTPIHVCPVDERDDAMKYLLSICTDGVATPEKAAVMQREMPSWIEEMDARGSRVYGHALKGDETATTVRVRDGQTLVSDGPFAESKEFIGGFDILECADDAEAIDAAAKHPVSWFHAVEVRRFSEEDDGGDGTGDIRPTPGEPGSGMRYLLMMCLDGIPGTPEEEASVRADGSAWLEELNANGVPAVGHALQHADTATTVRVRGGETLLSDGPFTESREFIGGYTILDCADLDAAIEIAAKHPLARFHMVEVRPFSDDPLGDERSD
jgi:hypothetical protein